LGKRGIEGNSFGNFGPFLGFTVYIKRPGPFSRPFKESGREAGVAPKLEKFFHRTIIARA